MPSVVFVCVANSCRSQMAEALAKSMAGPEWDIWSAGSRPSGQVHPVAVQMMQELGLSLAGHASKGLQDLPKRQWDYVVTMGCGDHCPTLPAGWRLDWQLPDPVGLPIDETRNIRDDIRTRVRELLTHNTGRSHGQG